MTDHSADWERELLNDPEYLAFSPEERERLLAVMEKMMAMGIGVVYGEEDPDVPDAAVNCSERLTRCRSICCTFTFALTREEVREGLLPYEPSRPFFIKREADGYCPHLDRITLQCTVWDRRPLRCRRYDCRDDVEIWPSPE